MITILYQGGSSLLTEAQVAKMISVEAALLASPNYEANCQTIEIVRWRDVGAAEWAREVVEPPVCASPTSILNYLHVNASAHEAQCRAGFCMWGQDSWRHMCSASPTLPYQVAWGDLPCVSRIFDWRDAVLTPADEWADRLQAVLHFQESAGCPGLDDPRAPR